MALTEQQKIFAKWLALPKEYREPGTQKELASQLEVTEATLCNWKKAHAFKSYTDNVLLVKLRDELGGLYESLIMLAKTGKHPRYMEMALQLAMGQFGKKEVDVRITKDVTEKMSTEDIASKMFNILNKHGDVGIPKHAFVEAVADQQPQLN